MSGPVGVVVIGRNEGERLRRCLTSVGNRGARVVYVDSGSTDGSVQLAQQSGAVVVELDRSVPFTAARARNAGFKRLLTDAPDAELVQFVDGDCEVVAGWMDLAERELRADRQLAVVCGRRRERFPERSIYNRLCDIEWDTPVGLADACGGDAMMRVEPVRAIGGYNDALIAGEEPDLCLRLRQRGFQIRRLDAEMTLHDAAMTQFGQWWRRSLRAGHSFAEGVALHGHEPERHWVREARSNWFWGLGVPALAVGAAIPTMGLSLLLFLGYGAQVARVYRSMRRRGMPAADARLYAFFVVLGKFPQVCGQILYWTKRLSGRRGGLIEYKRPEAG